ncbi:hypothetical protein HN51_035346 [Arachis hypogaea]|uniref:sucrose transport protein SUC3-like isoform X1 n=1 Tax=Arachis ipaensis TaxID=130454 RepID=UPI0007AFDDDF|nr:sucrose transport protein SUC3-like isoform X1 [Arachis ipaensis]XP_016188197.1 sucrose transport protein SUC3-like isoform X1 [Arachis ipaensis]XP_020974108.1 sucrose transport protein SUC3-like isoform X1 [Arachis ipaensis]XP_020974109.1 sucrose transport protein SUC3-like isoform X1 [Arachis ipaensis]XP_025643558.1 sucrose transport protein SUC3 isoform X1 [Arachis hypogaea]XP_025643559.1 sucrose transport protein SUC3 isoform X1 [Arachis hypogaea]XP_025643560.1 sucrose transport protei
MISLATIGYLFGDTSEHSHLKLTEQELLLYLFLGSGCWILPTTLCRDQLGHFWLMTFSGPDQHNVVNAIFCSWMAVGNILEYSAGASGKWNR